MIRRLLLPALLVVALAGCAPTSAPSTFASSAAPQLQSVVLAVTEAAHAGDFAAAAAHLDALEASTIAAFARGEVSEARFDAIMMAIALVRGDLEVEMLTDDEPLDEAPTEEPVVATDVGSGTSSGGSSSGSGSGASGSSGSKTENSGDKEKTNKGRGNTAPPAKGPKR
jgi:hypothetical protein